MKKEEKTDYSTLLRKFLNIKVFNIFSGVNLFVLCFYQCDKICYFNFFIGFIIKVEDKRR